MSHEVGKKKTRKQKMKNSKPEKTEDEEIERHATEGLIRGER